MRPVACALGAELIHSTESAEDVIVLGPKSWFLGVGRALGGWEES